MKVERKCLALAKRMAICENSVDGQSKPSSTPDCDAQRRRWQSLCTGVAQHEQVEPDMAARTQAISEKYRVAARQAAEQPLPEPRGGALMRWLASSLASHDADGATRRAASAIGRHPAVAIVALSSTLSALLLQREASKPSNAGLTGAQRIMGARVGVQAVVVMSTVAVMALAEVVEACDAQGR